MTNSHLVTEEDLQIMLLSTFRYSLGRKTYMSEVCADFLTKWWHVLPESHRQMIQDEIRHGIRIGNAGSDCDVAAWERVLEL